MHFLKWESFDYDQWLINQCAPDLWFLQLRLTAWTRLWNKLWTSQHAQFWCGLGLRQHDSMWWGASWARNQTVRLEEYGRGHEIISIIMNTSWNRAAAVWEVIGHMHFTICTILHWKKAVCGSRCFSDWSVWRMLMKWSSADGVQAENHYWNGTKLRDSTLPNAMKRILRSAGSTLFGQMKTKINLFGSHGVQHGLARTEDHHGDYLVPAARCDECASAKGGEGERWYL